VVHGICERGESVEQRVAVGGGEHMFERVAPLELYLVVAAADGEPEKVLDEVRLGLEDCANGRLSHARCAGDIREGRCAIALRWQCP
jgi:hypothetical protein